jgi:hypothetical protein
MILQESAHGPYLASAGARHFRTPFRKKPMLDYVGSQPVFKAAFVAGPNPRTLAAVLFRWRDYRADS